MGTIRRLTPALLLTLLVAAPAHAGKRLATALSGLSAGGECNVVNVSDAPITVQITMRGVGGQVVSQARPTLNAGQGTFLRVTGGDRWCEFVVISGGSAKDLRASMVVYDPDLGTVAAIETAREK